VPIHYGDYRIFRSSLADFKRAVAAAGLENRVRYLDRDETYAFEISRTRIPAVAQGCEELRCSEFLPDCDFTVRANTEKEILDKMPGACLHRSSQVQRLT
jgi:hypothetical protein